MFGLLTILTTLPLFVLSAESYSGAGYVASTPYVTPYSPYPMKNYKSDLQHYNQELAIFPTRYIINACDQFKTDPENPKGLSDLLAAIANFVTSSFLSPLFAIFRQPTYQPINIQTQPFIPPPSGMYPISAAPSTATTTTTTTTNSPSQFTTTTITPPTSAMNNLSGN